MTYVIVALLFIAAIWVLLPSLSNNTHTTQYSQILALFDECKVSEYTLDLGSGELRYKLMNEDKVHSYEVPSVTLFVQDVAEYRERYNEAHPDKPLVQDYYKVTDNSWLLTVVPTAVLMIMAIVLFVVMFRQANGGGKINSFGRANIKATTGSAKKATFADVAGADEEKAEMAELVDFLKNPKKFEDIGARIPRGVLLLGPPGTGKTLLARAVAGEAGVPFFPISGSDFVEMFVGVGASRVRDLFEQAKKHAPSIVFIDEIDAVGRHRGSGLGGGHDEREQTLNQLLVEMDGFEENESVIVIAATNRRDILDPALLRPGRFDRQITVNYPDVKGREEILKVHKGKKPIGPDVDFHEIAKDTQGFTGADLENLLNEAAILAARANRKAIISEDIEEATMKVIAGPEKKSHIPTAADKKITAFHEAGHAVTAYHLKTQERVQQVSVVSRGMAAGMTWTRPNTEDIHMSRTKLLETIVMMMGGRAGEATALDDICTGASNDIERATKLAKNMVTKWGLSEALGPIAYGSENDEVFIGRDFGHVRDYSEEVAARIDTEVRKIVEAAYETALRILRENRTQLDALAAFLLEYEKVNEDEFVRIMNGELNVETRKAEDEAKRAAEKAAEEERARKQAEREAAEREAEAAREAAEAAEREEARKFREARRAQMEAEMKASESEELPVKRRTMTLEGADDQKKRRSLLDEDADDQPKKRRSLLDEDADDQPKKRRSMLDEDADEQPKKRRSMLDEDADEQPKKRRSMLDEDEDEQPKKRRSLLDEDADDQPKKRRSLLDEDEDIPPKKKRRSPFDESRNSKQKKRRSPFEMEIDDNDVVDDAEREEARKFREARRAAERAQREAEEQGRTAEAPKREEIPAPKPPVIPAEKPAEKPVEKPAAKPAEPPRSADGAPKRTSRQALMEDDEDLFKPIELPPKTETTPEPKPETDTKKKYDDEDDFDDDFSDFFN